MGLEYQVCYNGGAQGSKCKQSRFSQQETAFGADAPPPPPAGGKPKKNRIHKGIIKMYHIYCNIYIYCIVYVI